MAVSPLTLGLIKSFSGEAPAQKAELCYKVIMKSSPSNSQNIYKKLKIASDLFELAVKIKSHQLTAKYPQATPKEIKLKVIELIERDIDGCLNEPLLTISCDSQNL